MIPRKNLIRAIKKSVSQPGYAWRNLNHRLKSAWSYHFGNGRSYWPETISLFLTYRCNLRCVMCGQWGENGAFREFASDLLKMQLSTAEIKKLIDDVAFFKPNITLFGGEPMLHADWLEIVRIIKAAGLRCNIVTNGSLVHKWTNEIVASGLDEIIFSLDGPEEIHDAIRRIPGTYQRSIDGFMALKALKAERHTPTPLVSVNTTLSAQNIPHLEEIIGVAESIGASGLTFHHLLFLARPTVLRFIEWFKERFGQTPSDWIGFAGDNPPDIDTELLVTKIHAIRNRKHQTDVAFFPNLADDEVRQWYRQFPFKAHSYKNRCMSLWMTAYIFPEGDVRPYHTMNFSTGNIRRDSFTAIWNNPVYRDYRRYIREHKCFEVCSKGCTEFFRY